MSTKSLDKAIELEAELLTAFVNTHDVEDETDEIAAPEQLAAWITERTSEYVAEPDAEDLRRLLGLRESLRALLGANNGGEVGEKELAPLREAADRSRYRLSIAEGGHLGLEPARADLTGFEARLLLAIERLQAHGAWPRLKACTNDGCQWAFFDTTRNRSRTWCSMDVCGNREKLRRYRARGEADG